MAKSNLTKIVEVYDRIKEEEQAMILASTNNIQYISLVNYPFVAEVIKIIPIEVSKNYRVISFMKIGNKVRVASPNPFSKELGSVMSEAGTKLNITFEPFVCSKNSFDYAIKQYETLNTTQKNIKMPTETYEQKITTLKDLQKAIETVSTTKLLETLLSGAVSLDASDIHFEPMSKDVYIRFRIDGKLLNIINIPNKIYQSLASRIKNSSNIKLDLNKQPQDGRFSMKLGEAIIDIRVNTIPSSYGETIELRLLTPKSLMTIDSLGFNKETQEAIIKAISKPEGLILFTGPTGSGKTTSLYSVLQLLNQPDRQIVTIEDPVEYRFDGIEQIQVNPSSGFDFPQALRSVLRQDPNIIMVGEIRDKETAEIAVNAALTGHLVLSTLHTNRAPAAFVRLLQMGVPKYLMADAISLIVTQKLVRRICSNCNNTGCDACHYTGFKGRLLISEFYIPNETTTTLIKNESSLKEFDDAFKKEGYKSLHDDGMDKVAQGLTSENEIG